MKYHFKIHKEESGFWAECIELRGCFTQADTLEELCDNIEEVLNLYLIEPKNSKCLAPLPDTSIKTTKHIIEVPVDPQVAFSFMVRYFRLKEGLTQQQAADLMGFDKIYSYQRLESKRCNPSLTTISRVKEIFPSFSLDFAMG